MTDELCSVCEERKAEPELSAAYGRPVCVECFIPAEIEMEDDLAGRHDKENNNDDDE